MEASHTLWRPTLTKIVNNSLIEAPKSVYTITMAIELHYSAAEYACPVWYTSVHARHVDVALNETCRITTGRLRATPTHKLYNLVGIAPSDIRLEVATNIERCKVEQNVAHPLHGHQTPPSRLKSRKSFLKTTVNCSTSPSTAQQNLWTC